MDVMIREEGNGQRADERQRKRATGDPWLDLYAGIVRQAVTDANQYHDRGAAIWLWRHEPDVARQLLICECE